jgi:geranylgeranyl diphosphate synthase, type I
MAGPTVGVISVRFPDDYKPRVKELNEYLMRSMDVMDDKNLKAAMCHYPAAGGKRLRPLLATMVCEAVGGKWKKAMPFGIGLEIVHNFTLVHDDVMDDDDTRRGIKTVHAQFGVPEAILAGDALFARAFEVALMSEVSPPRAVKMASILGKAVRLLSEGQQMDMDFENAKSVTPAQYMKMIELKTAVLYSAAAQGGVVAGGGTEAQENALAEYGRLIGLGFQIWDDVLDLRSDQETFGKPVLNDIRNGKKTLIVVSGLEDLEGVEKKTFLKVLGNKKASLGQLKLARDLLEDVGAVDHAATVALELVSKGKSKLSVLKDSSSKSALIEFADFMVSRKT